MCHFCLPLVLSLIVSLAIIIGLVFSQKRFRYSFFRTLFYSEPLDIKRLEADPLVPEKNMVLEKIDIFLKDDLNFEKILFIVGPWGSGKTHQVMNYKSKRRDKRFCYKSFIGFRTLETSYLHILSGASKFFVFLIIFPVLLVAAFWFTKIQFIHQVFGFDETGRTLINVFLGTFVSIVFISNYFRISYLIGSVLETFIFSDGLIFIIDDLDRSSLTESDQWAFL